MATSKGRFPSKLAILQVFAICTVPIHIWSYIAIFRAIPSWILSMTLWEMLGVVAYPLTFALLESLLLMGGLVIAAAVLPERFYRQWFVSQSTLIVFSATIWAVLIQIKGQEWGLWTSRGIITLLPLFLLMGALALLNARFNKLQKALDALAERLVILGGLYFVIDILFLFIFISRNLLQA